MTIHRRTTIRRRVESVLGGISGVTVQASRVRPWQRDDLPAMAVRTPRESITRDDKDDGERRVLTVVVAIADQAGQASDDVLDGLVADVEAELWADRQLTDAGTLGQLLIDWQLEGIEVELVDEGDRQTGVAEVTFRAEYLTDAGNPTA